MTEKRQGREAAFAETYDEAVKRTIEKAFLKQGISYLIKVDKVREMNRRYWEKKAREKAKEGVKQ